MIKALVYGSCVSRDLVAIHSDRIMCVDYIARQSWISASSAPLSPVAETKLTSKFQQDMLDGDFASSAITTIESSIDASDVLILDLIDDRFGVFPLDDGYITPTAEFAMSGIRASLDMGIHIRFGTDRHFELWTSSAKDLKYSLGSNLGKTFLLRTIFTSSSVDGSLVPDALERKSMDWNQQYERYYEFAKSIGFQVIALPTELAVSTPHHQWGIAPFHYIEAAYGWWLDRIIESIPILNDK